MSFKVVVTDGADRKTVHEITDKRVTKVHFITRTGEAAAIPVSGDETDILLEFEFAPAGQLNVADIDKFKPGYKENQTAKDVAATEKQLAAVRGSSNEGTDLFTQDAVDAAAEAEAAPAGDPEPTEATEITVNA